MATCRNAPIKPSQALVNAATAITALLVYTLNWGRHAEATIITVMLIFFTLSAGNHAATAYFEHNLKPVNLLRPLMTRLLIAFLLPAMSKASAQ